MSMGLINWVLLGLILMTCPFSRFTSGEYSPSGSLIIISSSVTRNALAISRFAEKLLPEPGVPRISPLGFFSFFAVHHDEVVGQGIQAVVQRFFSALIQFLRGKGDEDGRAAGGQSSLNFDLAICQRQAAHQPLLLLEIQPAQIAVVLLGDAGCLKNIVFQFLLRAPGVQHQKSDEEHPLVLALQFFQQGLCISAIGCQIRRNDVDIISGTDGFLLLLDL